MNAVSDDADFRADRKYPAQHGACLAPVALALVLRGVNLNEPDAVANHALCHVA